jgi:hypothetical protein
MPPQRKKAKVQIEPDNNQVHLIDPTLHPDLVAQSTPVKMDPALHPDLAAASTSIVPALQQAQFTVDVSTVQTPPAAQPKQPKQRKNAAAASKAAEVVAAQLRLQQEQLQEQQQHLQQQELQQPPQLQHEEPAVSVDAAAEFLRTIQERESQKNLLALTAQQQDPVIAGDNSIPTDLSALQYPLQQAQPSYQGFPTAAQFNGMLDEYLSSLSPKKQAKALLTQQMYDDILTVLLHPTETKTGSAQFRFWAKKMFKLISTQVAHIVIHDNKPVAVKEQLYDVLVQCHGQASHGGRDKTAAQVRKFYSWVPKELIARFVKGCPSCVRNTSPN